MPGIDECHKIAILTLFKNHNKTQESNENFGTEGLRNFYVDFLIHFNI